MGAVSRNLHELQDRQGSYLSIYDQPSLPLQVSLLIGALSFLVSKCIFAWTMMLLSQLESVKLLVMYTNVC